MGIKKVLDDHRVNYSKRTIVQGSNLKEKLERLKLKWKEITVMSLDIVNMYPLVRVKLIRKALNHYAKDLAGEAKNTINQCMDIAQFGMKITLIQFREKYFVYHRAAKEGELADKDVAPAIGANESAFLAYIVASYVFEQTEECFRDNEQRKKHNSGCSITKV
eukprot:9914861-Ditylum_brightwellii.AAC.1